MESRSEGIGRHFSKRLPVQCHRQEHHGNCEKGSESFEGKKSDRAKALLEYRARCTSARFWVQSQLLDLRLGLLQSPLRPPNEGFTATSPSVASCAALEKDDLGGLWSVSVLLKQYLKSPCLSKLVHRDPLLARRLNSLDDILWHRFGRRQGQTAGEKNSVWMPHEEGCPHVCGCVVPGLCSHRRVAAEEGAAPQSHSAVSSAECVGPSRTSTADSFATHGTEALTNEKGKSVADSKLDQDAEDQRPVTVVPSCRMCLEHFAFIVASLLLFLKPSELRDLTVERQQYQCCGFIFCGRRNVESPEKHQAALWRWTLEFAGLKTVTKDELLQFCCGHCWSRQQQLLQLLDEEPMYTRPGIREWISEVIERKSAYRAHPHFPCDSTQPSGDDSHGIAESIAARNCCAGSGDTPLALVSSIVVDESSSARLDKRCDVFDSSSPEEESLASVINSATSDAQVSPIHVDFSGDSDDGEDGGGETDGVAPDTKSQGVGGSAHVETNFASPNPRTYLGSLIQQQQASLAAGRHLLMLNYQATDGRSSEEAGPQCVDSATEQPSDSSAAFESSHLAVTSGVFVKAGVKGVVETSSPSAAPLPEGNGRGGGRNETESPPSISRLGSGSSACSTRPRCVRFADESQYQGCGDAEAASETESENACSSALTHYYNLSDEDDGLNFYARNQRTAAAAAATTSGRCSTGELRSILKPTSDIVAAEPEVTDAGSDLQGGYMRLSDVVIAFDLVSSCCTDSSAQFLREYHRRFCTCTCGGSMPAAPLPPEPKVESEEAQGESQQNTCGRERRKRLAGDAEDSDSVSCVDGESGDELVDPADLWQRRQQQLLTGILRSLPPSAESFAPLLTELCRTFRPVQPLPTLRCSLCTCLAALLLLIILLLRAKPLTCCCCCEGCRPWESSHRTRSKCHRRSAEREGEGQKSGATSESGISFYFDDALTLAKEEDVGLALVDFVRSTIQKAAPFGPPLRFPGAGGVSQSASSEGSTVGSNEEQALHLLLESIFTRISRPLLSDS